MSSELDIVRYAITPETPREVVAERVGMLDAIEARAAELRQQFDADLTEWIKANGALDTGRLLYWLGHAKDTVCEDEAGAVRALVVAQGEKLTRLLMEEGGDIETAVAKFTLDFLRDFVKSKPLKVGALKQQLGDDAAKYLRVVVRDKLETGEQLPKRLQKADKQFIQGSRT